MILFLAGAALTSCSIAKLKQLRNQAWLERQGRNIICTPSRYSEQQRHYHITVTEPEMPAAILDRLKHRNVSDFMLFDEKSGRHE